ncbi:MAG: DUF5722 domain-containing protein, partial [Prosthecobacter sp.]|nr:DUF5722 domain-containing protein [Prosthecobacter sp.]
DAATLRFRTADGSMTVAGTQPVHLSEAWQPWAFDLSQTQAKPAAGHPEMRFHIALHGQEGSIIQLRGFRVRERNAEEEKQHAQRQRILAIRQEEAREIRNQLAAQWPARLTRVIVDRDVIHLSGETPQPARLLSLPPEVSMQQPCPAEGGLEATPDAQGRFQLTLPRRDPATQRDHALWRWRLAEKDQPTWLSAAKWPEDAVSSIGGNLPRMTASHPKGLGGVPPLLQPNHEIFQLGIHHVTLNMVLNALLREKPAPGYVHWPCEGRDYFANEAILRSTDATMRELHSRGIIVSIILLVGNHRHADGSPHSLLTHPEAEARGIYSMPNLSTQEGARLYAAAIRLLAERYSGQPESPGRISNWILHNEIDQAGTWTNMGDQPLERYLESYHRSARIVHQTARLFDRQARVFISLTHHWTRQSTGSGTYVVRDLIELFQKFSTDGGDFEWGVAYHPYPRDLRNPDTWQDSGVTDDFDTEYITPRNLQVLPAYLSQPHLLFQGRVRGILLSEQGFNSPTLSERDQRRQAAGLVYVFEKLRDLPEIEAFHLHRYQDMPKGEGGLRLGLMTETGTHKLAWDVYREIGTGSAQEKANLRAACELWEQ